MGRDFDVVEIPCFGLAVDDAARTRVTAHRTHVTFWDEHAVLIGLTRLIVARRSEHGFATAGAQVVLRGFPAAAAERRARRQSQEERPVHAHHSERAVRATCDERTQLAAVVAQEQLEHGLPRGRLGTGFPRFEVLAYGLRDHAVQVEVVPEAVARE